MIERSLGLVVHEFDGIFQGNDMHRLGLIDLVQQGRKRRGFADAGGPGHENQPIFLLGRLLKNIRQFETFNGGNLIF